MTRRVFTTAGWNQTGDGFPKNLGEIDGVQTISYLTIDKAAAACVAGDVVEPCRPGMQDFSFVDADGNPLKTVVVPLGETWTMNKAITLQGGWCRPRLDGGGSKYCVIGEKNGRQNIEINDVDFARLARTDNYGAVIFYSHVIARRCAFLGCNNYTKNCFIGVAGGAYNHRFEDCAAIRCKGTIGVFNTPVASAQRSFTRCVWLASSSFDSVDCIDTTGWTQAQWDATFVKPPQLSATWTADDWQNIDLRLLPTSEYATGATSVQSGQEVYDLAGVKRKVGGALGAYEVLDATPTHYPCESRKGWKVYATRDDETAPKFKYGCMYIRPGGNSTHIELDEASNSFRWSYKTGDTWTGLNTRPRTLRTTLAATNRIFRATFDDVETADSKYCTIQFYDQDETAPADAVPCKFLWSDGRFFKDATGAMYAAASSRPTSESVVYIDENIQFEDAASQNVGKIIQEGFVHTDLGGAEGEIILGDRATAKTCGKLTWSGQTTTSAAALARVVPREPAELTFKECNISD